MSLPGDENARIWFVVPKSVPCDVNGEPVNMLRFQEFPELVEGSGMYRFECSPTFLFGTYWVGPDGETHYFRPEDPHKAKHVFVQSSGKTMPVPAPAAPLPPAPASEEAPAAVEAVFQSAELRDYVDREAVYRPNPEGLDYFVMRLVYNGVEFNDMVDVGYQLEDFQLFCAQQLKELRERCQTRWDSYYGGATPADYAAKAAERRQIKLL